MVVDNLLCGHVELPHDFFGWMGKGDHFDILLLLALFNQNTPSLLKVIGCWVVMIDFGLWIRAWA